MVHHQVSERRACRVCLWQVYICARRFKPAGYDAALNDLRDVGYG